MPTFRIQAIANGDKIELPAHIIGSKKDICDVQLTNTDEHIFFKVHWNNQLRYTGNNETRRFAVLTPLDVIRLDELYLEHKFFFIGYDLE